MSNIETFETHWGNGQLRERCTLKEGKPDGLYESWHKNGKPWARRTYKDGKLVEDLSKQEKTKMETIEVSGKNKSVRITLKGVEIEVEESALIEALEAKGIKTFKPEPEPKRKPEWAVNSTGGIVHLCIYNKDHIAAYIRQGRAFYTKEDAEAFLAMERQMAAVVGIEPEKDDWGWTAFHGTISVSNVSFWQAPHALGLTAKTREELEPKIAVFQRFQQIEKVRLEDLA